MNIIREYDSIDDFYLASSICTPDGNQSLFNEHSNKNDPGWIGLSLEEIKQSKYSYKKGLDSLDKLDLDTSFGGSKAKYVYDEFDGDDMNYDRLLEGLPALRKRVKTNGIGTGRIVELTVSIAENCNVEYEELLVRSYTTMQIIDFLEEQGYRVAVIAAWRASGMGKYKGENINDCSVRITIKKAEDPLIKPLILTCISPWFFRHHCFKYIVGHVDANPWLGSTKRFEVKSTKEKLFIDSGECLSKESAAKKIKEIEKLFSVE